MKVWLLFDYHEGGVEGVYTTAGKAQKDEQLFAEAVARMEKANDRIRSEIAELRALRKPFFIKADDFLEKEQAAKDAGDMTALKAIRKERKVFLRQAEHLTYDIARKEEQILATQRMTKSEILSKYCRDYYWEDYYLNGE